MTLPPWARDPLVHFLAAGLVVFAVEAVRAGRLPAEPDDASVIVVDDRVREDIDASLRARRQQAPTPAEVDAAVADWVETEVLVREGLKMGLVAHDPVIRARLVKQMGLVAEALEVPPEPDEATLRALWEDTRDAFVVRGSVTLRQLLVRGPGAEDQAAALLLRWQGGEDPRDLGVGLEPPPGGPVLRGWTEAQLARRFSADLARTILAMPVGEPTMVGSAQGYHVVQVLERTEARALTFEEARDRLVVRAKRAWLQDATERAVDRWRGHYRVIYR